jgi:NAD(P)H dehydrogenase (quinone)
MYAITGITGKVGGTLARALLADGRSVRAVVREARKASGWAALGCDVAIADLEDEARLTAVFTGAEAVFILPPSEFDPQPGYPEAKRVIDAVVAALKATKPARVLCLSTIGADAPYDNLLSQRTMMEEARRCFRCP